MAVEAPTKPGVNAEEALRARALDTIRTSTLEAILASDEPLRTVDVARSVSERLGLTLNDEEAGGFASLVRMVLDSDPLFSQSNRQWDLALRMGRAEGDRRKPVERAIEDFIDLLGHPTEIPPVAVLVAAVYGRPAEYYEQMISRIVDSRPQLFSVDGDRIAISRWLLDLSSDDPEDVEYDNFENPDGLKALRTKAKGIKVEDAGEFAVEVVRRADAPVDGKALQFLAWCAFRDAEPQELFSELCDSDEIVLERGPSWVTAEAHAQVLDTIRTIARNPEAASELVAASVPTEDEEIGILAPTTIRVSDEDLDQVFHFMLQDERTYRVPELCQQVLEAFPGSRTYQGVHDSLLSRMKEDGRFQWVGFERFRRAGTLPPEIEVLPDGLAFDDNEYFGEEGAEVDKLVDPREWKHGLDEQIAHYLVQEVGDDQTEVPATPPARLEASPPLHHYVAGTRYLRNADRGFFPTTPDLLQVTLATDDNRFDGWVNNRLGILFGLKEWYDANLPWVGGHYVLERTPVEDEYRLVYHGETEPLMEIAPERLQQLVALRGEAIAELLPLTEIVQRILKAQPEGLHFVTLFTQVNVVRRIRRALLASVLSGQRFFVQNEPEIWSFDEKRAAKTKGRKKGGPRRPMRDYEDEDEDLE